MDSLFGTSFQPIQARAFTDAYNRASTANRSARQAARNRMEVPGAAPTRSVSEKLPEPYTTRFGRYRPGRKPAKPAAAVAGAHAPAQAMQGAWPLSFAGVLAARFGA